jgi:hypothetical protein
MIGASIANPLLGPARLLREPKRPEQCTQIVLNLDRHQAETTASGKRHMSVR